MVFEQQRRCCCCYHCAFEGHLWEQTGSTNDLGKIGIGGVICRTCRVWMGNIRLRIFRFQKGDGVTNQGMRLELMLSQLLLGLPLTRPEADLTAISNAYQCSKGRSIANMQQDQCVLSPYQQPPHPRKSSHHSQDDEHQSVLQSHLHRLQEASQIEFLLIRPFIP